MTGLLSFLFLAGLYVVPTIAAWRQDHPSLWKIALLNILLGWTVVGWIAAFAWAFSAARAEKKQNAVQRKTGAVVEGDNTIVAKGAGGTMKFNGREVLITRKGGLSLLIHGLAGEKAIAISGIQAVQLRPARFGVRGYLQLTVMGGNENRGGAVGAAGDENSVLFDVADQPAFEQIAEAIRVAIHTSRQPVAVTTSAHSDADELEKLAGLRDRGILTSAEFDAKKAKILGL